MGKKRDSGSSVSITATTLRWQNFHWTRKLLRTVPYLCVMLPMLLPLNSMDLTIMHQTSFCCEQCRRLGQWNGALWCVMIVVGPKDTQLLNSSGRKLLLKFLIGLRMRCSCWVVFPNLFL